LYNKSIQNIAPVFFHFEWTKGCFCSWCEKWKGPFII
jgi:hypothetical protein